MDILSDKIVVTRKEHTCSACLRKFPMGTKMRTQVYIADGIQTWRECPTCNELIRNFSSRFYDTFDDCYPEGCVSESLEQEQTPEMLLEELKKL